MSNLYPYINNNVLMSNNKPIMYGSPMLTYIGATHTEQDVIDAGGTVYDTGNGTIGHFNQADPPSGWVQADNWNAYIGSTSDACKSFNYTPILFSNIRGFQIIAGSYVGTAQFCSEGIGYWINYVGGSPPYRRLTLSTSFLNSTGRTEIGCI